MRRGEQPAYARSRSGGLRRDESWRRGASAAPSASRQSTTSVRSAEQDLRARASQTLQGAARSPDGAAPEARASRPAGVVRRPQPAAPVELASLEGVGRVGVRDARRACRVPEIGHWRNSRRRPSRTASASSPWKSVKKQKGARLAPLLAHEESGMCGESSSIAVSASSGLGSARARAARRRRGCRSGRGSAGSRRRRSAADARSARRAAGCRDRATARPGR